MKRCFFLLCVPLAVLAQQTAAPTPDRAGDARGAMAGNFNIVQDWELGYRLLSGAGNLEKYRSDVNFSNGVRLLSSRMAIRSRDGHGAWFDELTLFTQGLGNDPYQNATLRLSKNRLYRYDFIWRSNSYFNPAFPVAGGLHRLDVTRRMQDHDFTVFPQSSFRLFLGWSRVSQDGAALTTINLFDGARGDEFPLFADVSRRQTEFRVGNEFRVLGAKLNWMQVWERYSEAAPQSLSHPSGGASSTDRTTLDSLARTELYSGTTPSFRLHLLREQARFWALNARFTWSGGRRDFASDEAALGSDRFGDLRNRQILVSGNARRPVTTAHVNLTLFPTERVTLTQHSSFHSTRMEGDSVYREFNNASLDLTTLNFQYLGIQNFTTSSSAQFQLHPSFSVRGGYSFAARRIRSTERVEIGGFPSIIRSEQDNRLHAGAAGLLLRPRKTLLLAIDAEIGRQDAPFYPISAKDYHSLSARLQWRPGAFRFSAAARSYSNFNSTTFTSHSLRSRYYAADASFNPRDWFSLDASYSKTHLGSLSGIAYFLDSSLLRGEPSILLSTLHHGYFGARVSIMERVDLSAGLSISRDAGGSSPRRPPAAEAFRGVQTFPMEFDSPLAGLSVRLGPKTRWNAGYQYYRYAEEASPSQNYRAHTAFTSVLWTF